MVNTEFSEIFKKYWTQDDISLKYQQDGEVVDFWIDEKGVSYRPSQRSQGQQWYLSFYINIVACLAEDRQNVILIDEPGLYLHARAQKDALHVLKSHVSTPGWPIIFSTHSPYLINVDDLENVRLVEKTEDGTIILGKIHDPPKSPKGNPNTHINSDWTRA